MVISIFSRAVALVFNWKYFGDWSLVRMMCRRHVDDMRVRFQVKFHWWMTYVIQTSSAHLPELLNFMQYYTWCHRHIICRHICHPHIICMSSAHTCVIDMSSSCHPHSFLSCPISCSTTPSVICTSSADTHIICMSLAYHLHVICTSSADVYIICTSSADAHVISNSPHGPQLYFLWQKY